MSRGGNKAPEILTDEAFKLAERRCAGTSTDPRAVKVLWIGEHLALLKMPGGKYHSHGVQYCPARVELVNKHPVAGRTIRHGYIRATVHTSGKNADGYLTKGRSEQLIERAKTRDENWLNEVAQAQESHERKEEHLSIAMKLQRELTAAKLAVLQACASTDVVDDDDAGRTLRDAAAQYRAVCAQMEVFNIEANTSGLPSVKDRGLI